MKIRKPWLIKLIGLLAWALIRCWMGTLRYRMVQWAEGPDHLDRRRERGIYAFWHETILFPTRLKVKIRVLISHHADGELIARVCRHLGFDLVRGSSRRGGTQALMDLANDGKSGHLFVTPDGPRGPRRKVQLGLVFLAAFTGLPIIPCGIGYRHAWRFNSWDRFALPWPWTTAVCVSGTAIRVPPRLNRRELERYRDLVEERMAEVTAAAESIAAGKRVIQASRDEPPLLRASA